MLCWLLNKLNKARPNRTCIGLALSPLACLISCSIAGCCQATIHYNDMWKRGFECRLCICYSASWLSLVLQLMLLLQCYSAYFTVSVGLVWYRLLADMKLLDLSQSAVKQERLVPGQQMHTLMCGERRPSCNNRHLLV